MKLDFIDYDVRFTSDNLYVDKVCTFLYKDYINNTKDIKSNPLSDKGFYNFLHSTDAETGFPIYIRKLFEILPDKFIGLNRRVLINYDNIIKFIQTNFNYDGVVSLETIIQLRNNSIDIKSKPNTQYASDLDCLTKSPYGPAILSFCNNKKFKVI